MELDVSGIPTRDFVVILGRSRKESARDVSPAPYRMFKKVFFALICPPATLCSIVSLMGLVDRR